MAEFDNGDRLLHRVSHKMPLQFGRYNENDHIINVFLHALHSGLVVSMSVCHTWKNKKNMSNFWPDGRLLVWPDSKWEPGTVWESGHSWSNQSILVPRAHGPFGQHQGSRPLAGSNSGSPRFTDSLPNLANLIGWKYKTSILRVLKKSGPATSCYGNWREMLVLPYVYITILT